MAVNITGDVPQQATTFGTPNIPANDENDDLLADTIDSQGNNVFDHLTDDDPTGAGTGLAWDDPQVWNDYDTTQNILVGRKRKGEIEINGGTALRYQHLVLGGVGDFAGTSPVIGSLNLSAILGTETSDFDYATQASGLAPGDNLAQGYGILRITGFGSEFSSDPKDIAGEYQTALRYADPNWGGLIPTGSIGSGKQSKTRPLGVGFSAHVGLRGSGLLEVMSAGRCVIQDRLTLGMGVDSIGRVCVDGVGSTLIVRGETNTDTASAEPTSVIGSNGIGELVISNGGSAQFIGGIECGARGSIMLDGTESGATIDVPPTSHINGSLTTVGKVLFTRGVRSRATWTVTSSSEISGPVTLLGKDITPGAELAGGTVLVTNGTLVFQDRVDNEGDIYVGRCGRVVFAGGLEGFGRILAEPGGTVIGAAGSVQEINAGRLFAAR